MTFYDALKSGRPARRKDCMRHSGSNKDGYIDLIYFYKELMSNKDELDKYAMMFASTLIEEDITATDWEVKP